MHGSTRRREETGTSRASTSRTEPGASRRPDRQLDGIESVASRRKREPEGLLFSGQGFTRLVAQSARRADDRVMTGPPWARNASGRTSFSPARSCAAVHGTAMCPSDTDIDGMFAGFLRQKHLRSDPVTRRINSTLAGESLRHKGADYATRRLELPTFVWSVVPPGLDSPPPQIKSEAIRCSASAASAGPPEAQAAAPLPPGDSSSARRRCDQVVGGRLTHIG
jgi:hypothetical protein